MKSNTFWESYKTVISIVASTLAVIVSSITIFNYCNPTQTSNEDPSRQEYVTLADLIQAFENRFDDPTARWSILKDKLNVPEGEDGYFRSFAPDDEVDYDFLVEDDSAYCLILPYEGIIADIDGKPCLKDVMQNPISWDIYLIGVEKFPFMLQLISDWGFPMTEFDMTKLNLGYKLEKKVNEFLTVYKKGYYYLCVSGGIDNRGTMRTTSYSIILTDDPNKVELIQAKMNEEEEDWQ